MSLSLSDVRLNYTLVFITHRSGCLDSYRSLVLKPTWEKAYYRCAESLSKLNDLEAAFSINKIGRDMCEQKADLERQYMELLQLRKYVRTARCYWLV